jgi:nucleoside-diphosphate-sugar epimerase
MADIKGNVLVSGAAGFIGSHLCERLLKDGHRVIGLDNFITGRKENLKPLYGSERFRFIHHDITERLELQEEVSHIFHLASPASPVYYQWYPLQTALVNSVGTKNLLDLTLQGNTKFLLASTSEVYGDPDIHPQVETYWGNVNPTGFRSCYDEGKRFAESLSAIYAREFGSDVVIARIFNTYGPNMRKDDGRVISNFVTQALEDEPITVYGTGRQTRSLCYVADMIDGLLTIMFGATGSCEVFNLGNPHEVTMRELAETIKELTGSSSKIVLLPLPEDDPRRRKPDITKISERLHWRPKITLKEGLGRTIEWFQSHAVARNHKPQRQLKKVR